MKVLLTGATGFIGKHLVKALLDEGHDLVVLSRHPERVAHSLGIPLKAYAWQPERERPPAGALQGVDAVIHLAGEGVAEKRWSKEQKRKIYDSRVLGTRYLMQAITEMTGPKPAAVISASAIGYYGSRGDEVVTETSPAGTGFLAEVCADWENEITKHEKSGIRLARIRVGVVLGVEGGVLKKLLPLFKSGLAGPVGSGNQWMSWIHVQDLVHLFMEVLRNPNARGAFNGVAPFPVTNGEFSKSLGAAIHRPAFLKAPAFALKLMLGEMSALVLEGQKVAPRAALDQGIHFRFPTVDSAFDDLLKKKVSPA